MKFDKVVPKAPWPVEKTKDRIFKVQEDIKKDNREMENINSQINVLLVKKRSLQYRVGNKTKYINQLQKQLLENTEWSEL